MRVSTDCIRTCIKSLGDIIGVCIHGFFDAHDVLQFIAVFRIRHVGNGRTANGLYEGVEAFWILAVQIDGVLMLRFGVETEGGIGVTDLNTEWVQHVGNGFAGYLRVKRIEGTAHPTRADVEIVGSPIAAGHPQIGAFKMRLVQVFIPHALHDVHPAFIIQVFETGHNRVQAHAIGIGQGIVEVDVFVWPGFWHFDNGAQIGILIVKRDRNDGI